MGVLREMQALHIKIKPGVCITLKENFDTLYAIIELLSINRDLAPA